MSDQNTFTGRLEDELKVNPYHWDSVKLANLFPPNWANKKLDYLKKKNIEIDTKQAQLNKLIGDTQSLIGEINNLSNNLRSLQKDATDYLNNFFNTGAYYRIIGFDAEISNVGELANEVRRVLNAQVYGKTGTSPDPNFPNFVGDTAQLGGFVLLFGAPSFDKIKQQFKSLGKYFPGLGSGVLGAKQTFESTAKAIKDKFGNIPARQKAFKDDFEKWKKDQEGWNNLKKLWDGLSKEEVTDTDKWHSLSIAQLIPALDPLAAGSPANIAIAEINDAFDSIQSLFSFVDGTRVAVDKLNQDIQKVQQLVDATQKFVDDVVNTVFNAGLYFHAYGSEYKIHTPDSFAQSIITSTNDTTDPKRPMFQGDTSVVGGIIAIVGAPDASGFEDSFRKFKMTWTSIGLSAESWGKSFIDLQKVKSPEEQKKVAGVGVIEGELVTGVSLSDYEVRNLVSKPLPIGTRVSAFLIQDQDIPMVAAGQKVNFTSANNVYVVVESSVKSVVTVTVLQGDIVTIKQNNGTYIATDRSQITSVIRDNSVKNYFAGEQLAREDGSVLKTIGSMTTVFHPNGSISQMSPNGTVVTTRVDGTVETIGVDGSKIVKYPTGLVRKYNKDGILVEEVGPTENKTSAEINAGKTEYLEDGSIKHIMPDGTIIIKKLEADGSMTVTTIYTDGREQVVKADGTKVVTTATERTTYLTNGQQKVEIVNANDAYGLSFTGTVIWIETDGTKRQIDLDGTETITQKGTTTVIYPDGSSIVTRSDGTTKTTNTDGTVIEVRKDLSKVIYFSDGKIQQIRSDNTYIIIYPNGEVENGVLTGEVTVQQLDGSITLQKSAGLEVVQLSDGSIEKNNTETGQTIVVTPNKITTTQADGSTVEVSDIERRSTDVDGNITVSRVTYELGSEMINGSSRQVIFKVTTYTVTKATGEQSSAIEREPNRDVVRVVNMYGQDQVIEVPAVRESGNVTKIMNKDDTLIVQIAKTRGNTTVLRTNIKSGEVVATEVSTQKLRGSSIDFSSEFE